MHIGVFCQRQDRSAIALSQRLNELQPGRSRIFDLDIPVGDSVIIAADTLEWNGVPLDTLDRAWISGFPYTDPVVPAPVTRFDWSRWNTRHLAEQQQYSATESLFAEMERRGIRLYNPRIQAIRQFAKASQLLGLQGAGCKIPPLLCSNRLEDVSRFCSNHPKVLWRPATGKGAWQRFTAKQKAHLIAADKPPVILAPAVAETFDLVWCLEGRPVLCLSVSPPQQRPVESLGAREDFAGLERLETLEMLTVKDASAFAPQLDNVYQSLGARWMVVTLAGAAGDALVYDVDTDPVFDWLPQRFHAWVIDYIAHALCDLEIDRERRPVPGDTAERPVLFLRRMLQIQYEMEQSKYLEADQG